MNNLVKERKKKILSENFISFPNQNQELLIF